MGCRICGFAGSRKGRERKRIRVRPESNLRLKTGFLDTFPQFAVQKGEKCLNQNQLFEIPINDRLVGFDVPVPNSLHPQGGSLVPKDGSTFFDQSGDFASRYIWASPFMKDKTVLDAGCGVGYGSNYLATTGATSVLGIDSDQQAISYALNTYKTANCKFQLMNVEKIDGALASSFDAVVSFEVIPYLSDIDGYLRGINNALRDGATYLLSAPNKHFLPDGKSTNKLHKKEYYPQELASLLKEYFSIRGMYVEFDRSYSASKIRELLSQQQSIPNKVARALIRANMRERIPLKRYWTRYLGETYPQEGRHNDFEILKVNKLEEMDDRFSNQLFLCMKP